MRQKLRGIFLGLGVMSLVSGCYCYPLGAYPHRHRYGAVSPSTPSASSPAEAQNGRQASRGGKFTRAGAEWSARQVDPPGH